MSPLFSAQTAVSTAPLIQFANLGNLVPSRGGFLGSGCSMSLGGMVLQLAVQQQWHLDQMLVAS
jgi:hypothetical protein